MLSTKRRIYELTSSKMWAV